MRKIVFFLSTFLLLSAPVWAQEIYLQGGGAESIETHDRTLGWGLEYLQGLSEHWAAGLTHINEGHIPNHHRDGYEPEIWLRTNVLDRRLSLAAGVGPYFYFDTTSRGSWAGSYDTHGWGAVFSAAATWYTESRLLYQIRANYISAVNSFDSVSVTVGIGYQLDAPATQGPLQTAPQQTVSATGNAITLFGGEAVLNQSQVHQHSFADAVEYRRGIAPYLDVTVGFLDEGHENDDRLGVTAQIWAVRSCFEDRVVLGVGVGPYLAHDEYRSAGGSTVSALIGLTGAYRFGDRWVGRFIWDRVLTNYKHDADVYLVGLGYRF